MTDNMDKMDYKDTLNLPRTDFPMRAKLPEREPLFLERWREEGLYARILDARRTSGEQFILHDGPPYANGNIHVGHVLNKILKDITVKFHTMKGSYAPFLPGWDCHGLPVEHRLFSELGIGKHDIDQVEFRKKAYDYAMKYVRIQSEEFQRLGILGDWDSPYLTLTNDYEAVILESLGVLYDKGYIYKDLKPVNWCASCETALAEAEVEYRQKVSPGIYVKFPEEHSAGGKQVSYLVWTTTPWTLVANVAVCLHPERSYAFVDVGNEVWVMGNELVSLVTEKLGVKDFNVVKRVAGETLAAEGRPLRHPFADRESRLVTAGYVFMSEGTGCVHIAPGHGQDDHQTGREHGLPTIMPVEDNGTFSSDAGEFQGMDVLKANKAIIDKLRMLGKLLLVEDLEHSYPHCWRCQGPVIFRATEQWFLRVDHDDMRSRLMRSVEEDVEWIPSSGQGRISAMVENRPDWCLSRQRLWGVPIPALRCLECGDKFISRNVIRDLAERVREEGSNVWFSIDVGELVNAGAECDRCSSKRLEKEYDILDVWFDSGVSHQAVLRTREAMSFPADMYLEGSDQHRGWFQAALITSMGMNSTAPFRKVLTHGFVVDSTGRKMSKSLGNVISPQEVMRTYGADILRLWVFSSDYEFDIKLSDEILERLADGYRKIRNTFKFLLSNLYDLDPDKDLIAYEELTELDRWLLSRVACLVEDVTRSYEACQYHRAYRAIYDFCVYEMSSFYLDVSKDPLYILSPGSKVRRSHQTAVLLVLRVLVRLLAPVLPFTAEEVWEKMPQVERESSVHLALWPGMEDDIRLRKDHALDERWGYLLSVRDGVMKLLEEKRESRDIGSSLEARLEIFTDDEKLRSHLGDDSILLSQLFKVSAVEFAKERSDGMQRVGEHSLYALVGRACGTKCQRCWNYRETVGANPDHPGICQRCRDIVLERRDDGQM